MREVRVTSLTAFNMCAYSFKNAEYNPSLKDTYRWDLLNIAASTTHNTQKVWMFLKWYIDTFKPTLKEIDIIWEVMNKWRFYLSRLRMRTKPDIWKEEDGKIYWVYQECKMMYKYSEDCMITWQPDLFYYNDWEFTNEDWTPKPMRVVEDLKFSTKTWYSNPDIIKYDCQIVIYPLFVMDRFWVDEVMFRHKLYDKTNGKDYYLNPTIITREYAESFVKDVVDRYILSHEIDDFEPNENPKCWFCDFKKDWTCPLWRAMQWPWMTSTIEEMDDDLGW